MIQRLPCCADQYAGDELGVGGLRPEGRGGCREEGHQSSKSDQKHLLPLRVLWAIIGGCAHTSNWQGSFGLKRNKKQRAIKSQRGERGRLAATHRRTPLKHCGASTARGEFRTQWERRSEESRGSATLIFPPPSQVPVHHSARHTLSIHRL